jgi:L-asparaginase
MAQAGSSAALAGAKLPLVVVVTTGGTIAEKTDPKTGALIPAVSGKQLLQTVPGLAKVARVDVQEFSNIDSSHMTPQIWVKLSRKLSSILVRREVDGVVVTHGTDTISEAAFFLDITLKTQKPVVLVGSMRGASDLSPDGPANIYDAVLQAASPLARGWGVTVTLNQYIWAARCVQKTRTNTVQTFNCGWRGFLGSIMGGRVLRYNQRPAQPHLPLPPQLAKVPLITTFAGDDGAMIRAAVNLGAQGMVLEALGQGNVNPQVFKAIKEALAAGLTVVVTSRVPYESVRAGYGDVGGGKQLKEAGVILSRELRGAKSRLLLMLALPQVKDPERLRRLFD